LAHLARANAVEHQFLLSLRASGVCPHRTVVDVDSGPSRVSCGGCPSMDLFGVIAAETFSCHEHGKGGV
jgi:hypothetical protein